MKKIFLFVILFIAVNFALSQDTDSQKKLNLAVDYSLFKMDNDNSYLEIYYSFSPLFLTKVENGKSTELLMNIRIKNINTNQIEENRLWKLRNNINDTASNSGLLVGLNRFILAIGQYSVLIHCADLNNKAIYDSLEFNIVIPPYKEETIALSDIEICNSIKQIEKDTNNIFYKNTFEVKPNPTSIIHYSYPLFGYYVECYNISQKLLGKQLITGYKVLDNFGKEYISKTFKKPLLNASSIETGIVNMNNLPGGSFVFVFSINDSLNKPIVEKQKKFFVYNPSKTIVPTVKSQRLEDDFSHMTEEEINKFFSQSKYIAQKEELEQFPLVKGVDAKRNFLAKFWEKREGDDKLSKENYIKRIKFANERYRTKFKEGWFTERGRVTLIYGVPEETFLERGKEDLNGRPYELWYYPSILNGVYFVFVDETGFNEYRLVHSSHPNEVHDQIWQNILKNKN